MNINYLVVLAVGCFGSLAEARVDYIRPVDVEESDNDLSNVTRECGAHPVGVQNGVTFIQSHAASLNEWGFGGKKKKYTVNKTKKDKGSRSFFGGEFEIFQRNALGSKSGDAKKAEKKRIKEEKKAEKKRRAAEKKAEKKQKAAEKKRLAAEKKAEKKRIREEKKAEKQRLKEEKKAEKQRLKEEKRNGANRNDDDDEYGNGGRSRSRRSLDDDGQYGGAPARGGAGFGALDNLGGEVAEAAIEPAKRGVLSSGRNKALAGGAAVAGVGAAAGLGAGGYALHKSMQGGQGAGGENEDGEEGQDGGSGEGRDDDADGGDEESDGAARGGLFGSVRKRMGGRGRSNEGEEDDDGESDGAARGGLFGSAKKRMGGRGRSNEGEEDDEGEDGDGAARGGLFGSAKKRMGGRGRSNEREEDDEGEDGDGADDDDSKIGKSRKGHTFEKINDDDDDDDDTATDFRGNGNVMTGKQSRDESGSFEDTDDEGEGDDDDGYEEEEEAYTKRGSKKNRRSFLQTDEDDSTKDGGDDDENDNDLSKVDVSGEDGENKADAAGGEDAEEETVDNFKTPSGLEYLGAGYDLLTGNPFGDSVTLLDPGYRASILQMHWSLNFEGVSNSMKYLQPLGAWIRPYPSCNKVETLTEVKDENVIQNDAKADASVTLALPADVARFKTSSSFTNFAKKATSGTTRTYYNKSYCFKYVAGLPTSLNWDFTLGFQAALDAVEKSVEVLKDETKCPVDVYLKDPHGAACMERGVTKWIEMFETFGTHVTTRIYLGGKILVKLEAKSSDVAEAKERSKNFELELQAQVEGDGIDIGAHVTEYKPSKSSSMVMDMKKTTFAVGGDIYGFGKPLTFEEWAQTVNEFAMPIKAEYSPLVEFLPGETAAAFEAAYLYYSQYLVAKASVAS